jgi:hypothetical protein
MGLNVFDNLTPQLQEPDSASDSSEDEDEDEEHFPLARKREFHLGRFCANRTVAFHKFMHWEVSHHKYAIMHLLLLNDFAPPASTPYIKRCPKK